MCMYVGVLGCVSFKVCVCVCVCDEVIVVFTAVVTPVM